VVATIETVSQAEGIVAAVIDNLVEVVIDNQVVVDPGTTMVVSCRVTEGTTISLKEIMAATNNLTETQAEMVEATRSNKVVAAVGTMTTKRNDQATKVTSSGDLMCLINLKKFG
jgi:hypothetical protein